MKELGYISVQNGFIPKKLSLGINMEYAIVAEDHKTDNIRSFDILSFTPTANLYFSNYKIRPYVALGIGIYSVIYTSPKINPGIRPIVGLNIYDYFELSLEYNKMYIPEETLTIII